MFQIVNKVNIYLKDERSAVSIIKSLKSMFFTLKTERVFEILPGNYRTKTKRQ